MNKPIIHRSDLLFPELSYQINGVLFSVFRELGGGHQEKYYQKAVALELNNRNIKFHEQYYVPVIFQNIKLGKYYLDFLVEDKIVLELKQGKFITSHIIDQVKHYLYSLNLSLALIACFTYNGVFTKRIINKS